VLVSDAMTELVLTVGPDHTVSQAAEAMWERRVGAAVVLDPEAAGPGLITERDVLRVIALGKDAREERVADHQTVRLIFAGPEWSLQQAAATMVSGGFRHLLVVDRGEVAGILSMRDIVRVWSQRPAAAPAAS